MRELVAALYIDPRGPCPRMDGVDCWAAHHCHALGCKRACPSAHLMCGPCWAKVPRDLQREVYRTVRLRDGRAADASWAPWWRAAHRAIHAVAMQREPNKEKGDAWLAKQLEFADGLEERE